MDGGIEQNPAYGTARTFNLQDNSSDQVCLTEYLGRLLKLAYECSFCSKRSRSSLQ